MTFDWISIIYIVIALIAIIAGFFRGLSKVLVRLIKSVVSLVLTVLFSAPVARLINATFIGDKWSSGIATSLAGNAAFQVTVTEANKQEAITTALNQLNIPTILNNPILKVFENTTIESETTLAKLFGSLLAYYIILVFVFIIIFIISYLIAKLFEKLFNKLLDYSFIKAIDKVGGLLLGAVVGFIIISAVSLGISAIVSAGGNLANFFVTQMHLDEPDVVSISKYFYDQNFLISIIAWLVSISAKIKI